MRVDSVRSLDDLGIWISRVVLVWVVVLASAPDTTAAEAPDRIDVLLTRYEELGLFNGSALIADGGQVILKKGYGFANMEWDIPNAPDTKFRVGSITKQFTAMLVMQLVEQGQIDLDAPIRRYLPVYPSPAGDRVTIAQLLNHTSGIVGYTEIPTFGATARNPYTPSSFVDELFSKLDLLFEPGTKFSYSNSGYFLLGVILERITGESYEELLRDRIFAPLGMNDSGYDSTQPLLSKRAAGYDRRFDGSYVNSAYIDMTQPYAAGSVYSTVEDLYKWDQALCTEQVLRSGSKERMFTPGLAESGYGWFVRRTDGVTTIEHGGGINGFNTLITRNPESRRLIVLLNNSGAAPLNEMASAIRVILDGKQPSMPKRPGASVLFETYERSGLAAMLVRAEEMQGGTEYRADNDELSRLANQLLATGKNTDALELAKKLAQDSPSSAAAAVLLGRAHRANGHRIEAVQADARALELSETPRTFLIYTDAIRELSELMPKDQR
jgi:CubicO group peptidase (beta-lactamase class C family)